MGMRRLAGAIVGAAACAASAQTMTYFWTVTTDDGDTNIDQGERAYLSMWALMDPQVLGFAESIYDIRGIRNWETGHLDIYWNLLWVVEGPMPDEYNNIGPIWSYQLPPLFNPGFVYDNPIELYRITWSTDDYTSRVVEVGDMNHRVNDVYTDEFGTSVPYQGIVGVARFTVEIPAPGVLLALGVGAVAGARRRR